MENYNYLDDHRTLSTIRKLQARIRTRFSDSSLADVCASLEQAVCSTRENIVWITTPLLWLRVLTGLVILLSIGALLASVAIAKIELGLVPALELLAAFELGVNNIILAGSDFLFDYDRATH